VDRPDYDDALAPTFEVFGLADGEKRTCSLFDDVGAETVRVEVVRDGAKVEFKPLPGSEFTLATDLVLLAMGFVGPERPGMLTDLGVKLTERGNVWRDPNWMTSVPGVFACGDMQRGQSLIVWAIAEGRSAARGVDAYLMGSSTLPAPLA
jgi:glutamate synthase (NADPH/NADH) small chain